MTIVYNAEFESWNVKRGKKFLKQRNILVKVWNRTSKARIDI